MIIMTGVVIVTYYVFFLRYFQTLFPPKGYGTITIVLIEILNMVVYFLRITNKITISTIPIMIVLMIVGLRFSTGMNWWQAIHGGSKSVIYGGCMCTVVTILCTIISQNRIVWTTNRAIAVSLPIAIIFFMILRRFIITDEKEKRFLQDIEQFKLVSVLEIVVIINLSAIYLGSFVLFSIWTLIIAFIASVLTIIVLIYVVLYSARSNELFEIKLNEKLLEEQIERQLNHYTFYQKHTESFRMFRHDYKSMMLSVEALIRANEGERAIELLNIIDNDMKKDVHIYRATSKSIILDAILYDVTSICEKNDIQCTFHLQPPCSTNLSQLNRIRIITNIVNNAIEACLNTPKSDRFIEMISLNKEQWAMLEVKNSYTGNLAFNNGIPISTKNNKDLHGVGLKSVHEIVKEMGGFIVYDVNEENHVFQIRVHIPRVEGKTGL